MNATYTKLRDGWGIRVAGGLPKAGESISVRTKSGKEKIETVQKVIWTGPDKYNPTQTIALCAIRQGVSQSGGSDVYERRDGTRGVRGCSACRNLGDICPRCRFDEDDC